MTVMKREWGCIYRGGGLHTNQRGYNATSSICTFTFSWITITLLIIWKYPVLSSLLIKYPNSAGPFFQTYNDILFSTYKPTHPTPCWSSPAQGWKDLTVLDLSSCSRGAIKAFRSQTETLYVVPCSLTESLSISWSVPHIFQSQSIHQPFSQAPRRIQGSRKS